MPWQLYKINNLLLLWKAGYPAQLLLEHLKTDETHKLYSKDLKNRNTFNMNVVVVVLYDG